MAKVIAINWDLSPSSATKIAAELTAKPVNTVRTPLPCLDQGASRLRSDVSRIEGLARLRIERLRDRACVIAASMSIAN
ncbi:hypothetical protein GCM10027271_59750 [Saccharopolyspora gloriosae]